MPEKIHFKIDGMHCNSCVTLITMELSDVSGITDVIVDLKTGLGTATLIKDSVGRTDVLAAVERAGYKATIID